MYWIDVSFWAGVQKSTLEYSEIFGEYVAQMQHAEKPQRRSTGVLQAAIVCHHKLGLDK